MTSPSHKRTNCEHGCRFDDLKHTYEAHCDDLDEALDYAMLQYNRLSNFIIDHVLPYLEQQSNSYGDEEAHDLLLDLAMRTHDFREKY